MRVIRTVHTPAHCPYKIPWPVILPHEAQALKNHGQTLEELQSRGGAGIQEIYAILNDIPYDFWVSEREASEVVVDIIDEVMNNLENYE
jgi:hypothetical protein